MDRLACPVLPFRGFRESDDFGSGGFAAGRVKAGIAYSHKGIDIVSVPGDAVIAPLQGRIVKIGRAYPEPECVLGSLHIEGASGLRVKLLYVRAALPLGTTVGRGQVVGVAQDVARWHMRHTGDPRKMINHVHLEVIMGADLLDPSPLLDVPKADAPPRQEMA